MAPYQALNALRACFCFIKIKRHPKDQKQIGHRIANLVLEEIAPLSSVFCWPVGPP